MNKHLTLFIGLQIFLISLSHARYTIRKIPAHRHNFYLIKYQLRDNKTYPKEKGILEETIKKILNRDFKDSSYELDYDYKQYQNKELNIPLTHSHYYNKFQCKLLADNSFNILSEATHHSVLFYLHNIRAGLKHTFSKIGSSWNTYIKDNKHTYLGFDSVDYKHKDLKVQYIVRDIIEPQFRCPQKYEIDWNALGFLNFQSKRNGKITMDSEGTIYSLLVSIPHQLKGFSIEDGTVLKQPVNLSIKKIDETTLNKILGKSTIAHSN